MEAIVLSVSGATDLTCSLVWYFGDGPVLLHGGIAQYSQYYTRKSAPIDESYRTRQPSERGPQDLNGGVPAGRITGYRCTKDTLGIELKK